MIEDPTGVQGLEKVRESFAVLRERRADAERELRRRIAERRDELEALKARVDGEWVGEDLVYRWWHQSFKVYLLQDANLRIAAALEALAPPGFELDRWFTRIVSEGTGREFTPEVNKRWFEETKPIVDAFFHLRHLLGVVLDHGDDPEGMFISSGWATVLTIYGLR